MTKQVSINVFIGAVFSAFAIGAGFVILILLCCYLRRRRARAIADTVTSTSALEKDKRKLLTELNDAQLERAQLRTYLQLADTRDPRDVVELFDKLNVSIRNSCLIASNAILKSVKLEDSWTTKNATNLSQLQKALNGADLLILSGKGTGRKLDEFLPEAFRFVVNSALVHDLFGLFHPGLSKNENELLSFMYNNIRNHDPQRLSARWRCSAYTAIEKRMPPSADQDWSTRFADGVLQNLSLIISSLFGENQKEPHFPAKFRGELCTIGKEAQDWNHYAKSSFKSLDFRPVVFTSSSPFDPGSMTLYQNHKSIEVPPQSIIVGVTMALLSTEAVSSTEKEVSEESVWQRKAEVLTEGFF